MSPLKIFFLQDIDLKRFTKYQGEKTEKLPQVQYHLLDEESFDKLIKERQTEINNRIKNTEIIVSNDGSKVNESSFEIIRTLGKGFCSKIYLAEKKDNKQLFALKVVSKLEVIKKQFFENLKNEKRIMQKIESPFVLCLEYCFASPSYIFFAMRFKQGGELFHHLKLNTRFPEI